MFLKKFEDTYKDFTGYSDDLTNATNEKGKIRNFILIDINKLLKQIKIHLKEHYNSSSFNIKTYKMKTLLFQT
ncbi:conjugal transfer protein TrbJ component (plasmid) [Campylobacter jejuni]|nr:conjugal transfer protein TrbJ component [Campylobacter jejuni]